jgi:hypothetical protein
MVIFQLPTGLHTAVRATTYVKLGFMDLMAESVGGFKAFR